MKVTVTLEEGRGSPWRVLWYDARKPVRRFFKTEPEAAAKKAEVDEAFAKGGMAAVRLLDVDAELAEAKAIAERAGRSVLEMVRSAVADARNANGPTLFEAQHGFEARCSEMKLRPKTVQFYAEQLNSLVRTLGEGKHTGEVTRAQIRAWIDSKPIRSRPHGLRAARAWFNWMLRQEPPLIAADPTAGMGVEIPKQARSIAFLPVADAKALLAGADPELRPALALMLFAGIRHNEMHRETSTPGVDVLQWADIDLKERTITVRHEVAKTGVARTIRNAPANVWAWLAASQRREGPVCASHLRAGLQRAQKAAKIADWSKSILRHSCASHHVAAYGDLSATALLIRHEGDVTLLNRRYREGVEISKAEGRAYFSIVPPKP